ncbi:MAG TPA: 16S rRNA (cytosine(1402)-N(4))-methyltransferase RsmH [Nitrospirales bacterium]|nr:16S rRNA (cytosine(1402)-N(4))-methyltransferase RsmH [Nitrospirales bacterium]
MEKREKHVSVLKDKVIECLKVGDSGVYIDGTVGAGGHAEALLQTSAPNGIVIGVDQDDTALKISEERLKEFGTRLRLIHGNFERLAQCVQSIGIHAVNGIVFDLGLSSMQLDDPTRGFSFQSEGLLDMRMDQGMPGMASHLVNDSSEVELAGIFERYGEERYARRIARGIVQRRDERPIMTTSALKDVIRHAVPSQYRSGRLHCATRVFQSLRIAVNSELDVLPRGIDQAVSLLALGGRLAVITFHSLEDRIVKQSFRAMARAAHPTVVELFKKPLRPSEEEQQQNRKSRSAKLRVLEKVAS